MISARTRTIRRASLREFGDAEAAAFVGNRTIRRASLRDFGDAEAAALDVYVKFFDIHLLHMLRLLRLSDIFQEEEEKQTWP